MTFISRFESLLNKSGASYFEAHDSFWTYRRTACDYVLDKLKKRYPNMVCYQKEKPIKEGENSKKWFTNLQMIFNIRDNKIQNLK